MGIRPPPYMKRWSAGFQPAHFQRDAGAPIFEGIYTS